MYFTVQSCLCILINFLWNKISIITIESRGQYAHHVTSPRWWRRSQPAAGDIRTGKPSRRSQLFWRCHPLYISRGDVRWRVERGLTRRLQNAGMPWHLSHRRWRFGNHFCFRGSVYTRSVTRQLRRLGHEAICNGDNKMRYQINYLRSHKWLQRQLIVLAHFTALI